MSFTALFRITTLLTLVVSGSPVFAQDKNDDAFLDPPYEFKLHPQKISGKVRLLDEPSLPAKSNTAEMIARQSPVRNQAARGTCSIFSATAILEAMLISKFDFPTTIDLSEEWLEYLIMRQSGREGSNSDTNFRAFAQWGSAPEADLPYVGETWEKVVSRTASEARCGSVQSSGSFREKACLLGHRDPELLNLDDEALASADGELLQARKDAAELRDKFVKPQGSFYVSQEKNIKSMLAKGTPVTMDIDFYYGAWNHRTGAKLGIPLNMDHWRKGIVGYPLRGSVDQINTQKERAGHSVLIVGYDDSVQVELEHLMPGGKTVKKTYKGVYYFKNSWGTSNFGVQFTLNGESYPGYGMIVQSYAHDYGTFYQLPL